MGTEKIIVITHPLITFPNKYTLPHFFVGETKLSEVDMKMVIEWKKRIYATLCEMHSFFFLAPYANRSVNIAWEIVRNRHYYNYEAYEWIGDSAVAAISNRIQEKGSQVSVVLVPVDIFNKTCARLHRDILGKNRRFYHEGWDLSCGAICTFDIRRGDAHVLILG